MSKVLLLVLNAFTHDSRVLKESQTLATNGYEVHVFALHERHLPLEEKQTFLSLRRFKLSSRSWSKHKIIQLLKYIECVFRMVWAGVHINPSVVHANDLTSLPIGFLISRFRGIKLVYDAHELWSDPSHKKAVPKWFFKIGAQLEVLLAREADAVMTVSDSIAEHMAKEMDIPLPTVVRNVPFRQDRKKVEKKRGLLQKDLGIETEVPVILYQGAIGMGRGVELTIDALQWISAPAVVVFLGSGLECYLEQLKERVKKIGLETRIYFHPPVSPSELISYTSDATIGISPIQGTCLSYQYCLPNKLFEYLQAGLPVLVSNLPEMSAIVKKYRVGETFLDGDTKSLARMLNDMLSDQGKLEQYQKMSKIAAEELHWEKEASKLLSVYRFD